mmetsp:Transcript_119832/g.382525  ORF Transcript_119832/g.382525 Transcript_119832/m.382525 type:complete len:326 (+) Transcript_119832:266-1243(+)
MLSCGSDLLLLMKCPEVPLDWLSTHTRRRALTIQTIAGLSNIAVALVGRIFIGQHSSPHQAFLWVGLLECATSLVLGIVTIEARAFELTLCLLHVLGVGVRSWYSSALFVATFWIRCIPLVLSGIRRLPFACCLLVDAVILFVSLAVRHVPIDAHEILGAVATTIVVSCCVYYLEQTRWMALFDVEAEKEASEALLSMICDAACWLAADGDEISRSDPRLDFLMGCSMSGKLLQDFLPEKEQSRLASIVGTCPRMIHDPATLLPSTLLGPGEAPICVDLFIVDRRSTFSSVLVHEHRGFLIGFRLTAPVEPPRSDVVCPQSTMRM